MELPRVALHMIQTAIPLLLFFSKWVLVTTCQEIIHFYNSDKLTNQMQHFHKFIT